MEEVMSIEEMTLQAAVDSGRDVRIIFTNGYQTPATIIDFDCNVIVAQKGAERWLIYRHAVSTIVINGER